MTWREAPFGTTWQQAPFRMTWPGLRSVRNDMAGGSVQNDVTEGSLSDIRLHSNVGMTTQPDFCIMRMIGRHNRQDG